MHLRAVALHVCSFAGIVAPLRSLVHPYWYDEAFPAVKPKVSECSSNERLSSPSFGDTTRVPSGAALIVATAEGALTLSEAAKAVITTTPTRHARVHDPRTTVLAR